MAREMGPREYKARRHLQTRTAQATSALGVAGLGALALSSKKVVGSTRGLNAVRKIPGLSGAGPTRATNSLKDFGSKASIGSVGIGSLGGFNSAALNEQDRFRHKKPVVKSLDLPTFGETGSAQVFDDESQEIEKAWSANGSRFDPEGSRMKRADNYVKGTAAASAGLGAAAGVKAVQASRQGKKAAKHYESQRAVRFNPVKSPRLNALRGAAELNTKKAAGLGVAAVGTAAASAGLKHKRDSSSWKPYVSKALSESAFGVDHRVDVTALRNYEQR